MFIAIPCGSDNFVQRESSVVTVYAEQTRQQSLLNKGVAMSSAFNRLDATADWLLLAIVNSP